MAIEIVDLPINSMVMFHALPRSTPTSTRCRILEEKSPDQKLATCQRLLSWPVTSTCRSRGVLVPSVPLGTQ